MSPQDQIRALVADTDEDPLLFSFRSAGSPHGTVSVKIIWLLSNGRQDELVATCHTEYSAWKQLLSDLRAYMGR